MALETTPPVTTPWRAADQARAELDARGPARRGETIPENQAENGHEVQADEPTAEGEAWPEAQAHVAADIDPEALTVMAETDADLAAIEDASVKDDLDRVQAASAVMA